MICVPCKKCECCGAELPEYATKEDWAYFDGYRGGKALFYCSYSCMRFARDGIESVAVVNRLKNKERKEMERNDMSYSSPDKAKKKLATFLSYMEQGMAWDEAAAQVGYTVSSGNPSASKNTIRTALTKYGMHVPEELMPITGRKKEVPTEEPSTENMIVTLADVMEAPQEEREAAKEVRQKLIAPPVSETEEAPSSKAEVAPCAASAETPAPFADMPDGMRISALDGVIGSYDLMDDGTIDLTLNDGGFVDIDACLINKIIRELEYVKSLLRDNRK